MTFNTLRELYLHSIETYGSNRCSSLYGGEKLTYDDFARRVDALTETFVAAGLGAGDKVALLSNNMPNWGVVYFTAAIHGLVIVPILPDFSGPEIDRIILHSEAKALVASDKLYTKVSKEVIAEQDLLVVRSKNLGVISHRKAAARGVVSVPRSEDLAAIIYTSGTTSEPKGVMLSHGNLCSELAMVSVLQPVYPTDIFLSILPLSHTFECSLGMLLPFMWGAQVVYLDKAPTASVLLPVLRVVRPTIMLSVPLIIEKIIKKSVLPKLETPAMKILLKVPIINDKIKATVREEMIKAFGGNFKAVIVGGAAFNQEVEQFLKMIDFPYTVGYGMTECGPIICYEDWRRFKPGSCGKAVPRMDVRVLSSDPENIVGEIVCKGPNVMLGYYKNEEATQEVIDKDGWLHTGDLALMDEEGNVTIKGRSKNLLLSASGQNIYPEEIEDKLNNMPYVAESIIVQQNEKLVGLVYPDFDDAFAHGLKNEDIEQVMEENRVTLNTMLPTYSQVSKMKIYPEEFEKTPKKSIKRYLYQEAKG